MIFSIIFWDFLNIFLLLWKILITARRVTLLFLNKGFCLFRVLYFITGLLKIFIKENKITVDIFRCYIESFLVSCCAIKLPLSVCLSVCFTLESTILINNIPTHKQTALINRINETYLVSDQTSRLSSPPSLTHARYNPNIQTQNKSNYCEKIY